MDLDEFKASLVGTCMSHGGCVRDDTRFPNEIVLGSNTEDRSFWTGRERHHTHMCLGSRWCRECCPPLIAYQGILHPGPHIHRASCILDSLGVLARAPATSTKPNQIEQSCLGLAPAARSGITEDPGSRSA